MSDVENKDIGVVSFGEEGDYPFVLFDHGAGRTYKHIFKHKGSWVGLDIETFNSGFKTAGSLKNTKGVISIVELVKLTSSIVEISRISASGRYLESSYIEDYEGHDYMFTSES